MEDGNLAVLVDAKTEYTKQLVNILKPSLYEGIKEIFIEARDHCSEEDDVNNTLPYFQSLLSQVPKWNQDIINTKSELIVTESKCDWLDDLITAVFISHTRILTSINYSKNKKKINLKIPKVEHFIHQCYISSARCFYKIPYMFDDTVTKYNFQRNRHEAEALIEESIQETIRKQLPVRNILKEYLDNESEETPENKEESYEENLRKMVKTEIEKCSKEQNSKLLETFKSDNNEPSNNEFEESKEASESLEISESTESTENNEKETPINEINLDTKEETKEDTGNKLEINTEESKVESKLEESKEEPEVELKEEPKVEESKPEESKPEESKLEESKLEESKEEEPKVEEPKEEESKLEEPKVEETKKDLQSNDESDILKNSTGDKETELITTQSNDKQLIVFNESENNTLSEKLDNSDIQEDEINLDIDELNLDDMNDLNNLEEVYLDGNPTTVENTKETPDELQNVEVKEVKLDSNIKKIVLDSKDSDKNKDDIKKKVLKNYIRKREDFDFFADADETDE